MTSQSSGSESSRVPWQTVVMVLVAFIVGLFPFVIAQSRYATKDEVQVIRTTQIEVLQRLANIEAQLLLVEQNTLATAANTAEIAAIQQQLATIRVQLQSILPAGSEAGVVPGPPGAEVP